MTEAFDMLGEDEQQLLDDFLEHHVFIHDDSDPTVSIGEWEGYDTAPYLLGADRVVCNESVPFGERYLEYLASLGCLPSLLIKVPGDPALPIAERLLSDSNLMAKVKTLFASTEGVRMSFFEARAAIEGRLASAFSSVESTPTVHEFESMNRKVEARVFFREAGMKVAPGEVCNSEADVIAVLRAAEAKGFACLLKTAHRSVISIELPLNGDDKAILSSLLYPVLVEWKLPAYASPIAQVLKWRGAVANFAVWDQRLRVHRHIGNSYPTVVAEGEARKLASQMESLASLVGENYGMIGVDFIATRWGLIAVDLNPRFCAVTYPLLFASRLKMPASWIIQTGRIASPNITSLSQMAPRLPLLSAGTPGIFLYCPVRVASGIAFSFLATAATRHEIDQLMSILEGEVTC
jgi:hypothetical protein